MALETNFRRFTGPSLEARTCLFLPSRLQTAFLLGFFIALRNLFMLVLSLDKCRLGLGTLLLTLL
jgi:hypothetical protein